jgi:putative sigma-54 modulation protein
MHISIAGEHMVIDPALDDFARHKLEKLERYLPNIAETRLELAKANTKQGGDLVIAQITVRHARGAILRAEERVVGTPQLALTQAIDKMYRQIQRFKGKRSRKGKERFSATLEELNAAEAIPDLAEDAENVNGSADAIVRRKTVLLAPMLEEEAIEQMELLGHTFFVYLDAQSNDVRVVYKRRTSGYGVLVPVEG